MPTGSQGAAARNSNVKRLRKARVRHLIAAHRPKSTLARSTPAGAPFYYANLSDDILGYIEAPANALAYSWKHFIGTWAGVSHYLEEISATAAAPVIEKYKDVLAAVDVCTENTAFWVMQSIRLDLGYGSQVHP